MRRRTTVGTGAVLLVVGALSVRGQDAPKKTAPPIDAYSSPQLGDWFVLKGSMKKKNTGEETRTFASYEVTKVTDTEVTVSSGLHEVPSAKGYDLTFPAKGQPSLEQLFLFMNLKNTPLEEVKVEDETYHLGDRAFKCKKVSFVQRPGKIGEWRTVAWFSKEFSGPGIIAFTVDGKGNNYAKLDQEGKFELKGYGPKDGVSWGDARFHLNKDDEDKK
jgi:hypothetical protein